MMDPSETHNFENQWKKAFEKASETPPPSIWEGIEARLDHEEKDRIIPLWWKSSKLWYAAASIAALLLVGGGLWYNGRSVNDFSALQNQEKIEMAKKTPDTNSEQKTDTESTEQATTERNETLAASESKTNNSLENGEDIASIEKENVESDIKKSTKNPAGSPKSSVSISDEYAVDVDKKRTEQKLAINSTDKSVSENSAKKGLVKGDQYAGRVDLENSKNSFSNKKNTVNVSDEKVSEQIATSYKIAQEAEINADNQLAVMPVDMLTPLAYSDLDVFMQKRYVFYKSENQLPEVLPKPKKPTEYWAGVGFMPATFNPDVKIKEAPVVFAPSGFANQSNSRQKSLTGSSKAGTSYAIQTQGGLRVSKHWSVELGLSYLQGNSQYEGGGYVSSAYSNLSTNVLESALSGLATSPASDKNALVDTGTYIDVNKNVSNDYQYLQLPVQAGFTLNPDKKLSYSLLGGMMANFFLSNELEAASGEIITTTASDDIYRSMNWAATTGLRFNYRLSSKWKASLTGSYQQAISSGFRTNQSMESHPYLYGVSWGVRYSF